MVTLENLAYGAWCNSGNIPGLARKQATVYASTGWKKLRKVCTTMEPRPGCCAVVLGIAGFVLCAAADTCAGIFGGASN